MELDYYLWKNKIVHRDFAKKCGLAPHTISSIVNKKRSPHLLTALKIHFEANGIVSLYELLIPEEREIIDKMYSIVKKESIYKDDSRPEERPIEHSIQVKLEPDNG